MIETYRRDLGRATREFRAALAVALVGIALVVGGVAISGLTDSSVGLLISAPGGAIAGIALVIAWLARRLQRKMQDLIDNYRHRGFGIYW